jgi:hypothetical protein
LFETKRDKVNEDWRKLHNESFTIYAAHQISLRVIKLRIMRRKNGSGAHPASYPIGAKGSFLEGEAAGS